MSNLEERIRGLEAIEDIKRLKARYWHACDHKDVEGVRECFADGPVEIEYAGSVGKVQHRDALRDVFEAGALRPEVVELHHGGPPRIELLDGDRARGVWSLYYHLMHLDQKLVHHIGGYYHDEYVRTEQGWRIQKTRFEVVSAVTYGFRDEAARVLHAGPGLPIR